MIFKIIKHFRKPKSLMRTGEYVSMYVFFFKLTQMYKFFSPMCRVKCWMCVDMHVISSNGNGEPSQRRDPDMNYVYIITI